MQRQTGESKAVTKSNSKEQVEKSNYIAHEQYASLLKGVESVQDYAIFMLDPDGVVATWNTGAEKIKGYRAEEIIGQHFSKFYPEEDLKNRKPERELQIAQSIGRFEDEGWRVHKDGSLFWANVIITAIKNSQGELLGFMKVTRDLTERQKIENGLRKAKEEAETARENYRLLIEGVRDYAIFMLSPKGMVLTWNKGAERISGYKATDIIGQHFSKFYMTEDIENGKCDFELKYALMEGQFEDEGWRLRKDGSKYWASVLITAVKNERGELVGFSKITRDITLRKETEQALLESEKRFRRMADKVVERTMQLEVANKELESFSYSVSHDLRAPLRSINGFSHILLESYGEKLDEEGKHYLKRIQEGSQQMAQLIDDMLNLSRLSRDEMNIENSLNLSTMVQEIVAELQEQDPKRQVQFDIQEGVFAQGDKRLLYAVLRNLLGNAWKFTMKQPKAHIEFRTIQQDGKTVYLVQDNGAGFDMAYVDKLFGPFQRLHSIAEFPGTGVGLATVQRVIHRHGGKVWAEGALDKGATFYFTLESKAER